MEMVYLPTCMVDFCEINVYKYTSPMDPMGINHSPPKDPLVCPVRKRLPLY